MKNSWVWNLAWN